MAQRDADAVQLDFPQLTADLIRELRLTGTLGLLGFSDQVAPVYIVASREGALTVRVDAPVFESGEVFDGGLTNAPANTVFSDTGQLPAGNYDIWGQISAAGQAGVGPHTSIELQHRNAANNATLAILLQCSVKIVVDMFSSAALPHMGYQLGLNERLRCIIVGSTYVGFIATTIAARLRPTP